MSELVNHVLLIYTIALLLSFPLMVALKQSKIVVFVLLLATLYCVPTFFKISSIQVNPVEAFQDVAPAVVEPDLAAITTETVPTARNPLMNVLVDEYTYNPQRPAAASVDSLEARAELDAFFRTEFTRDPTDVFGRSQSQRQFVAMPASTIPNDQESYQNWLYKIPGKTCKEGGREACFPGTDGATVPWLSSPV